MGAVAIADLVKSTLGPKGMVSGGTSPCAPCANWPTSILPEDPSNTKHQPHVQALQYGAAFIVGLYRAWISIHFCRCKGFEWNSQHASCMGLHGAVKCWSRCL